MVSTRIVIVVAIFIVFPSLGSDWVAFVSGGNASAYNIFDVGGAIGSTYGPCDCPPSNSTIVGEFWALFLPVVLAPGPLIASMVVYPFALALTAASLLRWRLMGLAGALALLSGVL